MRRRPNSLLKVICNFYPKQKIFIFLFEKVGDLKMEEKEYSAPDDAGGHNLEEVVTADY